MKNITSRSIDMLAKHIDWFHEQTNSNLVKQMSEDNEEDNDKEEQSLEEVLGKRSASTTTLSEFNEALNIGKLVEAVEAYRHAVGEHNGYPVSAELSFVADGEDSEWKVTINVKRQITQSDRKTGIDLMEHENPGSELIASSVSKSHTESIDSTVEAYKVFEDTCELYDLTEITDPEMPESEMLNPPEDKEDIED